MKKIKMPLLAAMMCSLLSCDELLDKKPNKKLTTPSAITDLQALMDNYYIMNQTPACLKTPGDEYYLLATHFDAVYRGWDKDVYLWEPTTLLDNDWANTYQLVLYANTVLDNIDGIEADRKSLAWKQVKGGALFSRAWAFYLLSEAFCKPFATATAATTAGIPLRLRADFSIGTQRATLQETYDRILLDLENALTLLPNLPEYATRPSRAAAFGLLGRLWLARGDYIKAEAAADAALAISSQLTDYNKVDTAADFPFSGLSREVLFYAYNNSSGTLDMSRAKIDSNLILSYAPDDLRMKVFFRNNGNGSYAFKGSYDGSDASQTFSGIAVDEVYLVKAEAAARNGNITAAMNALNTLLAARWKSGTFIPLVAYSPAQALAFVLEERKKELLFRGMRWTDIRRLNKDGAGIVLTRILKGQTYTLPPNDKRYTFLIPETVIHLAGITQNEQ